MPHELCEAVLKDVAEGLPLLVSDGLAELEGDGDGRALALPLALEVELTLAQALPLPLALRLGDCEGEGLPEKLELPLSEREAEALTLALLDTVLVFDARAVGVVVVEEEGEEDSVERLTPSRLAVGLGEGT